MARKPWESLLKAYEPAYRRGLLMDGLYRWPTDAASGKTSKTAPPSRRRMLLMALTVSRIMAIFRRAAP